MTEQITNRRAEDKNVQVLSTKIEGLATRRGLVRSVALSYATPKARQTVEVEVHV